MKQWSLSYLTALEAMKMIIETKLVTSLEFLYLLEETTYTELMHLEMNYAFNGRVLRRSCCILTCQDIGLEHIFV